MDTFFTRVKGDKVIWAVLVLLSLFSILIVYSSTGALAYKFKGGNTEAFLVKHLVTYFVAFGIVFFVHKIKYTFFSRISQLMVFVAAPLLLFTLLKGVSSGDATRWLAIPGTSLTFQTSDFAKVALIMYLARTLAVKQDMVGDFKKMMDFKNGILPILGPVFLICGLILPANFSTAAVLFFSCFILMFIGRVNAKFLLLIVASGIIAFGLFLLVVFAFPNVSNRVSTWKARIESFSSGNSEENYQAEQAMIAIATGGPLGKGPGKSTQRNFLPQASSDFIYAIIIEEYGMIFGGFFILLLYLILLLRSVRIVTKSDKNFGSFLAIGLSTSMVIQGLINMAVAVHIFPVTGQPLPFVSMGGTSLWFSSFALGVILSVSKEFELSKKEGGKLETA
ncbi:MAG: FtsW/RodA/SpoVE family cell cycle protein [Bacteroidota bacterium]